MGSSDFPVKPKGERDKKTTAVCIAIERLLSLNNSLSIIITGLQVRPKKRKIFILYFFKKGTFILEGGDRTKLDHRSHQTHPLNYTTG